MEDLCVVCDRPLELELPEHSLLFCPNCRSLLKRDKAGIEVVTAEEVRSMSEHDRAILRSAREVTKALGFARSYGMTASRMAELYGSPTGRTVPVPSLLHTRKGKDDTPLALPGIDYATMEKLCGLGPGPRLEKPEALTAKEAARALLGTKNQDIKGDA